MIADPGGPYWRSRLEHVLADPFGSEGLDLRDLITTHGVRALQGSSLRAEARRAVLLAPDMHQELSPGLHFLLTRTMNAGLSPAYDGYVGSRALTAHLVQADPDELVRCAARTVAEMLIEMLQWPALARMAAPDRERFTARLQSVLDACDRLQHGPEWPTLPPRDVVELTCLPDTDVVGERFFLRTTQMQEVIFSASARLTERAAELAAFGHVSRATQHVAGCARLLHVLLPKTFRMITPLTPAEWIDSIRPWIAKPSAIQAGSYRALLGHLETLHMNIASHRFEPWEAQHEPALRAALGEACRAHEQWYGQHIGIVRHYTPPEGSEALEWLERRAEDLRRHSRCGAHPLRSR